MRYSHRFRVRASLARVAEFHLQSASLALLTPPPAMLRVLAAPPILGESDEMRFTMGFGPARLLWVARIESVSDAGFADRQLAGPFAAWRHRHRFAALDPETTEVQDNIEAEVERHPIGGPLGILIWAGLPLLFAYRTLQTRRLLERRAARQRRTIG